MGTLLPVVIFAAGVAWQLSRSERRAAERRVSQSARALAGAFEREMAGSLRTLQALAEADSLDGGDLESFLALCERVRRTQPAWKTVLLISPEGQVLLNTALPPGRPPPPLAEPESFRRVLETRQPVVGGVARGKGSSGTLAFPVRVPVMRGDTLRYVLSAVVSTEGLSQVVARQGSQDEAWTRTLVDASGNVVARTVAPEHFVGARATPAFLARTRGEGEGEGLFADVSMEGVPVYVAFRRSSVWDWTAALVIPRSQLDAPLARSMLAVGGLGLALLLVSAGGSWLFSRRLTHSISEAAEAAAALSRGETPRATPSGVRELAALDEALARSGALLREREAERDAHLAVSEAAWAEAVAAARARDAFLAMLGHELRNPLAPIVTSMGLLRARGLAQTPEHDVITRQLRHVVRLVDDLLDVARITRGQLSLRPEPLELSRVVAQAVEAVAPLVEQRRHALEVEVPASGLGLRADPARLTQVFANLLTNAAKYTPPGGHLRVWARAEQEGVLLGVEDDGPGLPPDLLPRLFEPFVQGPRTLDRSEGGLGIGLALVRSLVEAHGGRVEAGSPAAGPGSCFTVWLPGRVTVEAPPPERSPPERSPSEVRPTRSEARAEGRLRVLVVDDNVDAAELMAELLETNGHPVAVAHDCARALERLEGFHAELVLLDIGLPDVDGYGVAARIRERLGAASPVFVALTGFGQEGDRARSREEGFFHHFVKPVDIDELLALVDSLEARRETA